MALQFAETYPVNQDSFDAEFVEPELFGDEGEILVISRNLYRTREDAFDLMRGCEWDDEYNLAQFSASDLVEAFLEYGKVLNDTSGERFPGEVCYRLRMEPNTLGPISEHALGVWILNTGKEPSVNV